ncbi:hypothetical protein BKE38_29690 [Pseudoroseomonas deserti]|uniref:Uncharacterized protein n=1 Tax=Teichococcus deserti TaxID=1817963 RepID=A0A1V2GTA6_9PROT|nr:hypothetical protein [Pseudoroseomonas deserti]ONG42353.1 hypothetical protein BKE38_29690 [Pseudoroseomonas deserti]
MAPVVPAALLIPVAPPEPEPVAEAQPEPLPPPMPLSELLRRVTPAAEPNPPPVPASPTAEVLRGLRLFGRS